MGLSASSKLLVRKMGRLLKPNLNRVVFEASSYDSESDMPFISINGQKHAVTCVIIPSSSHIVVETDKYSFEFDTYDSQCTDTFFNKHILPILEHAYYYLADTIELGDFEEFIARDF